MTTAPHEIAILMSAATFLTLFLFLTGIWQYTCHRKKRLELLDKIRMSGNDELYPPHTDPTGPSAKSKHKQPVLEFLGRLGKPISSNSTNNPKLKLKFIRAGIRRENAMAVFWGVKCLLAVSIPGVFLSYRLSLLNFFNLHLTVLIGILLALFAFYLPDFWLHIKQSSRKEKIINGMPDALDLLVVCVEAGMGLDAAINRVATEIYLSNPVLSEEFKLMNLELRAGKNRADALKNLAVRTNVEDVSSLVTLLIQADKFGTSIAKSLRVFSDSFRTKRAQKAEEIAGKLPVKLLFPMLLFIFPSLLLTIMGPGIIRIYHTLLQ